MATGKQGAPHHDSRTSYVSQPGRLPRQVPTREIEPAWESSALPDWVNYTFIPLFTAGEPWPADTKAVELGRVA